MNSIHSYVSQPATQPDPQPQPSGDNKEKSETDKNTADAKNKAKQDPKASKPNNPDSALSGIKDSFLQMVGVDPAKYFVRGSAASPSIFPSLDSKFLQRRRIHQIFGPFSSLYAIPKFEYLLGNQVKLIV